ncbi:ABC transporter permease [Marinobacterium mangrovicola]|uniref:Osmoprotectant transport system permease protein n=1 Tax=Marinobacterium mangrovicola TaxID=1476959 RepID=A0A4R1GPG6_9GAMM|nr:ABC transporter permease [Marinobacterium mangrovicola]TCK09301.1 osmoprotectant transport system permease protein [Marinobacterium mangrovicola]
MLSVLRRVDRLGLTLSLASTLTLVLLPLVNLQPNRILPGQGVALSQLWQQNSFLLFLPLFLLALLSATFSRRLWPRAMMSAAALLLLIIALGNSTTLLLEDQPPFARVSLGSGFWTLLLLLGLLMTDALIKLQIAPLPRLALVAIYLSAIFTLLASGLWDQISLMLEYHNQERFWQQGGRHLLLVAGSILPALLIGVPLGIRCHRSPRVRAAILPVLSLLQTIPSLAMFGLLMIPLSLLATSFPLLSEFGIRGIGAAPALLALFLYSLLPIVSNTAAGFDGLDPAVLQAAKGMGMNQRQRLWQVELPLALPVMLSGLRIVLTMNIGLVAVAGLIGGGGYGTYIFQGLGQTATDLVLLGTLPTILLAFIAAMAIDTLIALTQRETR